MFQAISDDAVPKSPCGLSTSQETRAGGFVFPPARCSIDSEGRIAHASFEEPMRRTFADAGNVLSGMDLNLTHAVQVRGDPAHANDLGDYDRLYQGIFSGRCPVRTTLVGCLPCRAAATGERRLVTRPSCCR